MGGQQPRAAGQGCAVPPHHYAWLTKPSLPRAAITAVRLRHAHHTPTPDIAGGA